jgi:hypothetical protein
MINLLKRKPKMKNSNLEKKLTDDMIRASIKEKMMKAGSDHFVEVDAVELAYVMRTDMGALIKEVDDILTARDVLIKSAILERKKRARKEQDEARKQDELSALAGFKEPDHKAHLDRVAAQQMTFTEAARPLMKWLADNHNPDTIAIIGATGAELVQGIESFQTPDYLRD